MWEGFGKIGFALGILIISAGLYLVLYSDKEVQQDVLEFSLNLMGDRLLAMVPEGADKNKLSELYEGFKQRAIKGIVASDKIENVAANILNVSNTETTLTSQQAEGILRSAMMAPPPPILFARHVDPRPKEPLPHAERPESERREILGERVKIMFEFNEQMHEATKEHAKKHCEIAKQIHYQVKDGLNLVVDASLKTHVDENELGNLAIEFKHLEQAELLDWRVNLSKELKRESEEMKEELEALHESLKELHSQHLSEALEELESLKSLENLEYIPVINADSIRKVVENSLREAGISTQYKKPE